MLQAMEVAKSAIGAMLVRRVLLPAVSSGRCFRDSTLLVRAPAPKFGHWRVRHVDGSGKESVRVIRVLEVLPDAGAVIAWCERSNSRRQFRLDALRVAKDVETGQFVDLQRWLRARRKSGRIDGEATQRRPTAGPERAD